MDMVRRQLLALVVSLMLAVALAVAGCGESPGAGQSSRTVLTSTLPAPGSQQDQAGQQAAESHQKPAHQATEQ